MKKLLFSFVVILSLLVLVSCPDGNIPDTAASLTLSVVFPDNGKVSIDNFESLKITLKSESEELSQEFPAISKISIPVMVPGNYTIIVEGSSKDSEYLYSCSGSRTITLKAGDNINVSIPMITDRKALTEVVSINFVDNIEKSSDYDLKISKLNYSFTGDGIEVVEENVEFSPSLLVTIPNKAGTVSYKVEAYNKAGKLIGGGYGTETLIETTQSFKVSILEKEGNGTIKFNLKKSAEKTFPEIKVGDEIVSITESEDGLTGEGSISLKNGKYNIALGESQLFENVRVIEGVERAIYYDFSQTTISIAFKLDVTEEVEAKDVSLDVNFKNAKGETYSDTVSVDGTITLPKSDWDYEIKAKTTEGKILGEAKGHISLVNYSDPYEIIIEDGLVEDNPDGNTSLIVSLVFPDEIGLDKFKTLNISVKQGEREFGGEASAVADFSISNIPSGEYLISVEGKSSDDNYVYSCVGSKTITIKEGKNNTVLINMETSKVTKQLSIAVSFSDKIEKSNDYDLEISKIDYIISNGEIGTEKKGVDYSSTYAFTLSVPANIGSLDYEVKAYNKDGKQIGYGKGTQTIDKTVKSFIIGINEQNGTAELTFNLKKSAINEFPTVTVDDKVVNITVGEDNTSGSGKITVNSGICKISFGETEMSYRVVAGFNKTIDYDFTENSMFIKFKDNIAKDETGEYDFTIESIVCSFKNETNVIPETEYTYSSELLVDIEKADWNYTVVAKNKDGNVIGRAEGSISLSDYKVPYTIDINTLEGDGTLKVIIRKDASATFPKLKINGEPYEVISNADYIAEITKTLKAGIHYVDCGDKDLVVRIVSGVEKTIIFDFSTPVIISLEDNIPKYDGFDMDIDYVEYSISSLDEPDNIYEGKLNWNETKSISVTYTPGLWEYSIQAFNEAGLKIGEADYAFLMRGLNDSISIEEVEGKGSANISIKLGNGITPSGSVDEISLSFKKDGDWWKANIEDLDNGNHTLTINGKENDLRIVAGMTTEFSKDFNKDIDISIDNDVKPSVDFSISIYSSFEILNGNLEGSVPTGADVVWYLGSTEIGRGSSIDNNLENIEAGSYALKAVVSVSGKIVGIAVESVELTKAK